MLLRIDPGMPGSLGIDYVDGTRRERRDFLLTEGKNMLGCLTEFLSEIGHTIHDVTGIAVVVASGRFTATRIATTMVNTLAFATSIPVLAVSQDTSLTEIAETFRVRGTAGYIIPAYSAPARIGGK